MKTGEFAVNVPIDRTFTYEIPEEIRLQTGCRVIVPFGKRMMTAVFLGEGKPDDGNYEIKKIGRIIDTEPVFSEKYLKLIYWMSRYYLSPIGETLFAAVPSAEKIKAVKQPYQYTGKLLPLNEEQKNAFETIDQSIGKPRNFLIKGVTGSGKTEVYKHLVYSAIQKGFSAIILIPEISLTPQNLERFYESFGETVAVYHSRMTPLQKFGEWKRAQNGEAKIIIGPRSAVFLPVQNLGIIIVDEEHEQSYKSQKSPRYHAVQVAFQRGILENAAVVLGSATPRIETFYHALEGGIQLIRLNKRFGSGTLPAVEILDLKNKTNQEWEMITSEFLGRLINTLNQNKQAMIFLNRRGFSPTLTCTDCGFTFQCPNCDVTLTYHKSDQLMICHHCGYSENLSDTCPECGSPRLKNLGSGTEQLEHRITELFSGYRILRMDLDTTRKKGSYESILEEMKNHEADILIGTQMIAKGHDLPDVQLVGILSADLMLNIPDFRSDERTFTLITQSAGRAGRRNTPGEALIQTYNPSHYAVVHAASQDYEAFYEEVIQKRRIFQYPPFMRLGRIVIRGTRLDQVTGFSDMLKAWLDKQESENLSFIGPVSCPFEKLKNNYRYHLIFKCPDANIINQMMHLIRNRFLKSKFKSRIYLEFDMDPLSLL